MKLHCAICANAFDVPPSRKETAKYCSRSCKGKAQSESLAGCTRPPETVDLMKKSLKEKWASGTRKRNPEDTWERARDTRVKNFPDGTYKPTREAALKALANRDMEKVREACRLTGKAKAGVPNPPGPSEAGPENCKAKYWAIRSPCGQVLRGRNLNDLIRNNAHLFDQNDIKWEKSSCKACKGIGRLFLTRSDGRTPCARSWKGWTPVLKSETVAPTPHHGTRIVNLPPQGS
jgi:hypothetical protein